MRSSTKYILSAIIICACILHTKAQVIQVVTKTIEKDIEYSKGTLIRVNAEKSLIEVHGWAKNSIHVKVKLISKQSDKKIAEKELDYLHFGVTKDFKYVELTNSFVLPKEIKKVEGNLKAEYEIWIPTKADIEINDKFGNIKLNGLEGKSTLNTEYCNIQLTGCVGSTVITGIFSDVKGIGLNGNFKCKNDHAEINLDATGGSYHIETNYGKITVSTRKKLVDLDIDASRCPVDLSLNNMDQYQYDMQTSDAFIILPSSKYNQYKKDSGHQKHFNMKNEKKAPLIKIKTSFEPISFQ